ncbi:MAG: hypothetical protein E7361_01830 [Clostridiales bacterium]|nr:hypothetical protein [Clostridiales bacterium]
MSYKDFIAGFDKKRQRAETREYLEQNDPEKLVEIYNLNEMMFIGVASSVQGADNKIYGKGVMPIVFKEDYSAFTDVWTGDEYLNTTNFPVDNGYDYREIIVKNVLEGKGFHCLNDGLDLSARYQSDTHQSFLSYNKAFCETPLISAFTAANIANEYLEQLGDMNIAPEDNVMQGEM